MVSVVTSPII